MSMDQDGDQTDRVPASSGDAGTGVVKKRPKGGTVRGIETMFRVTYRTHLVLSQLADAKANIMISLNGIIISILIASQAGTAAVDPMLRIPAAVLLLTCLASLVFAILAARPRVSGQSPDMDQMRSGRANILFFGNFVHLEEDVFVDRIQELMGDPPALYAAMARDVFGLGKVLDRKYRLISRAYSVFMIGLIAAVVTFVAVIGLR